MRFLTARRRHPAARALVLVFALLVMGGLYSALAPSSKSAADTGTSQQIEQGRELFTVSCASCHGLNGEGEVGGRDSGSILGPPLIGVGGAAVEFQVATGRMPMARPGPQAPQRPNVFTDEEIIALAAFVETFGPGPSIPEPAQYDPAGLSPEDLARGGELFRTNCSACHNFEGAGGALPNGKYAPTLVGVSNLHLYEAMITGPQQMPVFSDGVLKPDDKRAIIGYLNQLHEQPNRGGLDLGGLGPVSEGLWAWLIGIGGLVLFAIWIAAKGVKVR